MRISDWSSDVCSSDLSAPIAGLDLSRGLSGPLSCANGRAQAALASQSGMERLTLSFDGSGAYRAQFAINVDRDPAMAAALAALGFRAGAGGRSEARRVGKECVSTCRSLWARYPINKHSSTYFFSSY